jgi:sec-independent protein translocase protein TatA
MPPGLSPWHLAVAVVAILLFLGPSRLPQTGRAFGRAIREFRSAVSGADVSGDASAGLAATPAVADAGPMLRRPGVAPDDIQAKDPPVG